MKWVKQVLVKRLANTFFHVVNKDDNKAILGSFDYDTPLFHCSNQFAINIRL